MADVQFNLDGLLAQYKDYARGYLFKFEIDTAPAGLWREKYPYLVRSTNLPESTLEEITTDWQGMSYKFAGPQTYGDFSVTFNVDAESLIRYDFVNWMNFIHDPSSNVHGNPQDYMCILNLTHLNTEGGDNIKYRMVGAWPKTVGTASLDYGTKDTLQFEVSFAYQYHQIL